MGLSYDQLFPSRFIKAGEFGGKPVTLTITAVDMDELEKEDGTVKNTPVVSFAETKRQWVLIKTNAQCLLAMWGPDTDGWIGKRVTLYPEHDASGLSDSGLCIRVKGSPDITGPITATIKLPRRKPMTRKLVKTTAASAPAEPAFDTEMGEVAPSSAEPAFDNPPDPGKGFSDINFADDDEYAPAVEQ